jgi:hypothetical protein
MKDGSLPVHFKTFCSECRAQAFASQSYASSLIFPADVTLADLVAGWLVLTKSRNDANTIYRSHFLLFA